MTNKKLKFEISVQKLIVDFFFFVKEEISKPNFTVGDVVLMQHDITKFDQDYCTIIGCIEEISQQ